MEGFPHCVKAGSASRYMIGTLAVAHADDAGQPIICAGTSRVPCAPLTFQDLPPCLASLPTSR
ncbi:protein of unknown function [Paraburkholderia kururiensis]